MMTETELLSSDVVANATMNRGRGLSGVNSYARELRVDIAAWLQDRAQARGRALWYDACCGEGRALVEAWQQFRTGGGKPQVEIVGADLVGPFPADTPAGLRLVTADVVTFVPEEAADLITCVHGLHYLGDKLAFLQNAYAHLSPGGLMLAHLDAANLHVPGGVPPLLRRVRARGVAVTLKNHLLQITRTAAPLHFGLSYRGASVSRQPNYTGITVIDSWYEAMPPAVPPLPQIAGMTLPPQTGT